MSNQITLNYMDNTYSVSVNGTVIQSYTDLEEAYEVYKQMIKNNKVSSSLNWDEMRGTVEGTTTLHIEEAYKSMTLEELKFFYHTGKVFYMGEDKMQELLGGFGFFKGVCMLLQAGYIESSKGIASLCAICSDYEITYSILEDYIEIAYPGFSYGRMRYHFNTGKMDKGTAREKSTWDEFAKCVLAQL